MDMAHARDNSTEHFLVLLADVEDTFTDHDEVGEVGRDAQAEIALVVNYLLLRIELTLALSSRLLKWHRG